MWSRVSRQGQKIRGLTKTPIWVISNTKVCDYSSVVLCIIYNGYCTLCSKFSQMKCSRVLLPVPNISHFAPNARWGYGYYQTVQL